MANEILSQLFENQKIQMQRDAALRESLDSKVTNALSRVLNDDAALNEIKENIAYTIEQFDSLAQRVYGYTHEAIVTDNLEKDYQDITTANPDLANVSAVGLLAILSDGDTVTAQKNRLFINAVESHHGDVEADNLISVLVQCADTISAARPGARREDMEVYINRLKRLEEISDSHEGVEKSFAIQAGREVRIMVIPDEVSDADMVILARDISKEIEEELQYPGQIKVNVIRESRAIDYAK